MSIFGNTFLDSPRDDDRVRIERMDNDNFEHSSAFEEVSAFYRSLDNEGKEIHVIQKKIQKRIGSNKQNHLYYP